MIKKKYYPSDSEVSIDNPAVNPTLITPAFYISVSATRYPTEGRVAASIGITTALALSLFNDGTAVNQSLTVLHSATVMRGRAVARPSCDYTVDIGGIVDGTVDNNGEFDQ